MPSTFNIQPSTSPVLTGDSDVDFVLEAGPRVFGPRLPAHIRENIARDQSGTVSKYKEALKRLAQDQVAQMHKEIEFVSKQNRDIENSQEFKACNGFGYPKYRKPLSLHFYMESLFGHGCWQDSDFVDDVLKHHPGLRIRVTRGTHGQEYGGRNFTTKDTKITKAA